MVRALPLLFVALVVGACGTDVFVTHDGAGGGGAPASSSSSASSGQGGSSSSTSSGSCVPLTCSDVLCELETADGCGNWLFCPCDPCAPARSPASVADDPAIGTRTWDDPANAAASDDAYARVSAMINGEVSHYLVATDFGFQLPPDAQVLGIEVTWERGGSAGVGLVDHAVRIVKAGMVGTEDHSRPGIWDGEKLETYGGEGQLWGETWTPNDINDPDFGAAIATRYSKTAGNDWPQIDWVRITVHYTSPSCPP